MSSGIIRYSAIYSAKPASTIPLVANPAFIAAAGKSKLIAFAASLSRVAVSPLKRWSISSMYATNDLSPPIAASVEKDTVTFDFGPRLAASVTITSVVSVTCSVHAGVDPTPSARLIGTPQIGASPQTGAASQAVLQQVGTMVGGATYLLQCVVQTSDGNQPSIETHLPCVTPI